MSDVAAPPTAARRLRCWIVLILPAIVVVAADLGTKSWAFNNLWPTGVPISPEHAHTAQQNSDTMQVIPQWLHFKTALNTGALFGMGKGQKLLFIAASLVAAGFVLYMFVASEPSQWYLHLALALILGGAAGNLYDRATYGCVRDFIHIAKQFGDFELWPWVFNLADAFLVAGVLLVLVSWFIIARTARPT